MDPFDAGVATRDELLALGEAVPKEVSLEMKVEAKIQELFDAYQLRHLDRAVLRADDWEIFLRCNSGIKYHLTYLTEKSCGNISITLVEIFEFL